MEEIIKKQLLESAKVKRNLAENFAGIILEAARLCSQAVSENRKIMFCGNGGSAADSQHLATELVIRLSAARDRRALPGLALTTDSSALTACANDYGFENIFKRQLQSLGKTGDVLVAISTSGNSVNVIRAVETAAEMNIKSIGLSGGDGGRLASIVDTAVIVPAYDVGRIQEAHITIGHIIIDLIEREVCR